MKILDLLFPPKCVACKALLGTDAKDAPFCEHCNAKWEIKKQNAYREYCGQPLKSFSDETDERYGKAMFVLYYEPRHFENVESRLIFHLKNHSGYRGVAFAARELCSMIRENVPIVEEKDVKDQVLITWIPRRTGSVVKYGFDHMRRVAIQMEKQMGVPARKLIRRRFFASEQKYLGTAARQINARSSMSLVKGVDLRGKTVLLIDDVITSGASFSAAAELLIGAGARQVIAAALGATKRESERYVIENGFNIIKNPKSKKAPTVFDDRLFFF